MRGCLGSKHRSTLRVLTVCVVFDADKPQHQIPQYLTSKDRQVLAEDHVVRLDHVHSMPVTEHTASPDKEKLFPLSNTGFCMLVFKLSVRFFRFQENIGRKPASPG